MSAGFTPGPWDIYPMPIASAQEAKDELCDQVDHTSPVGSVLYLINAGGKCPAITGCGPTSEANARLIAAAPALYASVEALLAAMHKYEMDVDADAPPSHRNMMEQAYAALAQARGEQ